MAAETMNHSSPQSDDLLTVIRASALVWRHKWRVALVTALFTAAGIVYALFAPPVWTSEAVVAPKEAERGSMAAGLLSQIGDVSGLVASQIGLSSWTSSERIAIIARSHNVAERVVTRHDLLPVLFSRLYDSANRRWKVRDSAEIPTVRDGVRALKGLLSVSSDLRKQVVRLTVSFRDPALAAKICEYCVSELDSRIKSSVIAEARAKRAYLEAQMKTTADPWVIQKLQALAVMEMEKSMMVAGNAVVVLETPMVPLRRSAPRRRNIVAVAFFLGLFCSAGLFLAIDKYKSLRERYRGKVQESSALRSPRPFRSC
jgi:uncharacterized protein involved in exopolysaccharide biosynthesis